MPARDWLPPDRQLRGFRPDDRAVVLELINADQLPGQPPVTEAMLDEALAGRSAVDAGWWAELDGLRVEVLLEPAGEVIGVVSFASRRRDDVGVLLWLHAHEQPVAVAALVGHAMHELAGHAQIDAYDFASALTLGVEALPVRHRPVTAAALRQAGFADQDLWRYMRRDLPADEPLTVPDLGEVHIAGAEGEAQEWKFTARRDGAEVGEISMGAASVAGVGVLWWIGVDDTSARGKGIGRALLLAALIHLREQGATQAILYVDDDEPGGARDRTAANRLYDRVGFVEVDRLLSFQLRTGCRD